MRIFLSFLILCSTVALATSCASSTKTAAPAVAAKEGSSDLLWTEAQDRKVRLSDVTYDLKVDITAASSKAIEEKFTGDMTLRFKLKGAGKDLRLDFFEGEVKSLVVNGKAQPLTQKKPYWIDLPKGALVEGNNEVRIEYLHAFARTGDGLHRFIDPVDGKVYLHTQFETFDANRFMPCFDQPDLRSVLTMTVLAPKDFMVVTASKETSKEVSGDARLWVFEPSAQISTYLFSLHAGPFFVHTDKYKRADGSVLPLRIMVRPALKSAMKEKEWFKTTKDGLAYFEKYFGTNYPFTKLDQLVVPEFNSGGMENVGAITYTEYVLPRSVLTRKNRRGISSLMLHEIAHMWFGDLVTMAWWNNLWLNESFATFMSAQAQADATEFKEVWQTFGAHTKARAYIEDAMGTTHPIEAPIATVKEAMTNFDAITYNKGASVLKQLNYYMTAEAFREGIRDYFKTYAYQNTTLSQFIGSLQKHTKKDLSHWADRWLRQSGADTVSASFKCEGDRLKAIDLKLDTTAGRKDRPQSMEVALYGKSGGKTVVQSRVRADFEGPGASQTQTLRGDWKCPVFVYPNHDDHAYVMVKLDSTSLAFLTTGLSKIDDRMTRTLVWNDLWRMVRETELSLKTYVDIVSGNFSTENDEIVLQQVLSTISRPSGSIFSYWPTAPASKVEKDKFVSTMETEFLRRVRTAKSGSDAEKLWYDAFAQMAQTPTATEQLYKWYASGKVSKSFALDVERNWTIASTLTRFGHAKASLVVSEMKKKDTTDRGIKAALSAEASEPAFDTKKKFVEEFTATAATSPRSLAQAEAVLFSLFPIEQRAVKLGFASQYFSFLEKNRASEEQSRVGAVINSLMPLDCEAKSSGTLKEKVNAYPDMNPSFKKGFLMSLEEDERCQRVRARSSL